MEWQRGGLPSSCRTLGGLQVFFRESEASARFEIALKCGCFFLAAKDDGGFQFPRPEFGRAERAAGIVLGQPGVEIVGKSNVTLVGVFRAAEIARMWRFSRNNGITEGFHTKMEMISRRAYGFKNFDNYRLRVRACCC